MTDLEPGKGAIGRCDLAQSRSSKWLAKEKLNACADPLRLAIVSQLSRHAGSAAELAQTLGVPREKVRYHLRRLSEAGLVEVLGKAAGARGQGNIYSVEPEKLALSAADLALLPRSHVDLAHARLLRLLFRESIDTALGGNLSIRHNHALLRFPVTLDEQGWREGAELHEDALRDTLEARKRSYRRSGGRGGPVEALAGIFYFERSGTIAEDHGPGRRQRTGSLATGPNFAEARHILANADPLRVSILTSLSLAPAGATELAELLGFPVERVRHQLNRLADAGLVVVREERRRRGTAERIYAADNREAVYREANHSPRRREVDLQLITVLFREALDATKTGTFDATSESVFARIPMALDEQGMTEITFSIFADSLERMFSLQEESRQRLEAGGGPPRTATSGLLLFETHDPSLDEDT